MREDAQTAASHAIIVFRHFPGRKRSALARHHHEATMFTPRTPNARPAIQSDLRPYRGSFYDQSAPPREANTAPGDPAPMVPGDVPVVPPSGRSSSDPDPDAGAGATGKSPG
jgi:hypothetical protein